MEFNYKSRKGFTLIELLVVIGILAVLAAIAIPSVAGLIDRANVSADKTNSSEYTNAIERFASEYELYCQDIASGIIKADRINDFDSAQGRVFNVTGITSYEGIKNLEISNNEQINKGQIPQIYRDTKYPTNAYTVKKIVENYTKTSSATFEPKQSDMHYWYSPDCGIVVYGLPNATAVELNAQIVSNKDAKGNDLSAKTKWIDLTAEVFVDDTAIDMSTVSFTLEQNTWQTIYKVARANKVAEAGWKVGDTKTFNYNGRTLSARIIGINHDSENSITFMFTSNIGNQKINGDTANDGGWEKCDVRGWLNTTVYSTIGNDVKPFIKTVEKTTNNIGYHGTSVSSTQDKLFLLSLNEIGLCDKVRELGWYNAYMNTILSEGETYEYFETDGYNRRASVADWWYLRSPNSISNIFFSVDIGGTLDSQDDFENVLVPAFVIG